MQPNVPFSARFKAELELLRLELPEFLAKVGYASDKTINDKTIRNVLNGKHEPEATTQEQIRKLVNHVRAERRWHPRLSVAELGTSTPGMAVPTGEPQSVIAAEHPGDIFKQLVRYTFHEQVQVTSTTRERLIRAKFTGTALLEPFTAYFYVALADAAIVTQMTAPRSVQLSKEIAEEIHNPEGPPIYVVAAEASLKDGEVFQPGFDFWNFWIVDARQATIRDGRVVVPSGNKCTIGLLTLVFAALWVSRLEAVTHSPQVREVMAHSGTLNNIYCGTKPLTGRMDLKQYQSLHRTLTQVTERLPRESALPLSLALGARISIDHALYLLRHGAGEGPLASYCPESLSIYAALWLFSPDYRDYAQQTVAICRSQSRFKENTRLLPFDFRKPPHITALLYYASRALTASGVTVEYLHQPELHSTRDINISPGLDTFEYFSLEDDGKNLQWHAQGPADKKDDREQVDQWRSRVSLPRSPVGIFEINKYVARVRPLAASDIALGTSPEQLLAMPILTLRADAI